MWNVVGLILFVIIIAVAFGKRPSGSAPKLGVVGWGCIGGTAAFVILFFLFGWLALNSIKEGTRAI